MGDLKVENTSYPAVLDTATVMADGTDEVLAAHNNGPNTAIVAIETELGINPSGSAVDMTSRLATNMHNDGGLLRGSVFPVSPPLIPHYFYKSDENKLYIFNVSTASYDAVSTAVVLAGYIQKDVPTTITAQHTFNPVAPGVPFILGANSQGQLVTGLNADQVDGQHRVLTINADHTHTATGATGGIVDHTSLSSVGTNTHTSIDAFIASKASSLGLASLNTASTVIQEPASKAQASGVASLDASSLLVQNAPKHFSVGGIYVARSDLSYFSETNNMAAGATSTVNNVQGTNVVKSDYSTLVARAGGTVDGSVVAWVIIFKTPSGFISSISGGSGTAPATPATPAAGYLSLAYRNNHTTTQSVILSYVLLRANQEE